MILLLNGARSEHGIGDQKETDLPEKRSAADAQTDVAERSR